MTVLQNPLQAALQPVLRPPFGLSQGVTRAQVIAALFGASEQGAIYDPSDLSTLSQDDAGTTPVTADSQPVGRILDVSGNGNHATQATAARRPLYRTDGTLHWLEFDGVDDLLQTAARTIDRQRYFQMSGGLAPAASVQFFTTSTNSTFATYIRRPDAAYFDGALKGGAVPTTANATVFGLYLDAPGNVGKVYENGAEIFTSTYTAVTSTGISTLGGPATGGSGFANCRVYAVIGVENSVIDSTTRSQVEQYIAEKTGVVLP